MMAEVEEGRNVVPPSASRVISNGSSSSRRHSDWFPRSIEEHHEEGGDSDSEYVSEAGDIGDRVVHSNRSNRSIEFRLSSASVGDKGSVVPVTVDLKSYLDLETAANAATTESADKKGADEKPVSWLLDYISLLVLLSLFGILGVVARYYLEKLFGPGVIGATNDKSYMYLDLPCNMAGSFLMGWLGVVYKENITNASKNLAVALTTGFLGSLTTFSGWNQKMLDLSVNGSWGFAVLGFLIGLCLCHYSIIYGIVTAKGSRSHLERLSAKLKLLPWKPSSATTSIASVALLSILSVVWSLCVYFAKVEFNDNNSGHAQLLIACAVGPFGVWIRWRLARFNGRGLGKRHLLRWMPFGTLTANVLAACIMAVLAISKRAAGTTSFDTIATGIQIGFLGCLSTVSTFIAEFHAMRESKYSWRAEVYAMTTIFASFVLGTLIYSVPVWTKAYDR